MCCLFVIGFLIICLLLIFEIIIVVFLVSVIDIYIFLEYVLIRKRRLVFFEFSWFWVLCVFLIFGMFCVSLNIYLYGDDKGIRRMKIINDYIIFNV